jgi:hypothetical protein
MVAATNELGQGSFSQINIIGLTVQVAPLKPISTVSRVESGSSTTQIEIEMPEVA